MRVPFLFSLLLFTSIFAQEQWVTVIGKSGIVGNNLDAAKNKALSDGLRNAVEKGLGVWVQSHTEVSQNMLVKDQILSRSEGYVTEHEILSEGPDAGMYVVTIKAKVSIDKIGADFKALVGRTKTQMGNPTIAFVLTTWDKRGVAGSYSQTANSDIKQSSKITQDAQVAGNSRASASMNERGTATENQTATRSYSGAMSGSARQQISGNDQARQGSISGSVSTNEQGAASGTYSGSSAYSGNAQNQYAASASSNSSASIDANSKTAQSGTYFKIDETVWKKYPDMTIIDAFQQEFREKGFDLKATDDARNIALSESIGKTAVDPSDRAAVRALAEKEGANFVARGEAQVLNSAISPSTGTVDVTSKIGVEIIDVNSGDIVASYSNTTTATNRSEEEARAQSIKKVAVLAARTLADQTIGTWQERIMTGRQFAIEIRNVKNVRSQKIPLIRAIESLAQITSQTAPTPTSLLFNVMYKGDKNSLGISLLESVVCWFTVKRNSPSCNLVARLGGFNAPESTQKLHPQGEGQSN